MCCCHLIKPKRSGKLRSAHRFSDFRQTVSWFEYQINGGILCLSGQKITLKN